MLLSTFSNNYIEAGCDEAGRGCLAGPVFAAAVILPRKYRHPLLNDSKKLSAKQRENLRDVIERDAISWAVESVENEIIDEINILNASILAMHKAIARLHPAPELILADGNRFHAYPRIAHKCIVRGDCLYLSIAAASILAKTYRDKYMAEIDLHFPGYGWKKNKGYPTEAHRAAILKNGITPFHRKSFKIANQMNLFHY